MRLRIDDLLLERKKHMGREGAMSYTVLGANTSITRQRISEYANGTWKTVSQTDLVNLASFFKVKVKDLFDDEESAVTDAQGHLPLG